MVITDMGSLRPIVVLFDSDCALCRSQMRFITRLDWLHKLSLVPLTDPCANILVPGATTGDLREAIHCVTPDGRVHRGARCFRHLAVRLPLLVPLALALWLPGVIGLAEKFYGWVSRNRHRFERMD